MRTPMPHEPFDEETLDDGLPDPTPEQVAGVLEAREQARQGRTYTPEEVDAELDAWIDSLPERRTG